MSKFFLCQKTCSLESRVTCFLVFQKRQPTDPSSQFIRNYFSGFANDPIWSSLSGDEKREVGTPDAESDEKEKVEEMEKDSFQTR